MTSPAMLNSHVFDKELVSHGFFGRSGGISTGEYASLNCGPGSQDDPAAVLRNRESCRTALHADKLVTLYQVHSSIAVFAAEPFGELPRADAIVTDRPGLMIGILTADCIPVLFHDPVAGIIGAAHAGWRGALAGILENCVSLMTEYGASPADIRAGFGPCLRQDNFEVGPDLIDAFQKKYPPSVEFLVPGVRPGKSQLDLAGFAKWRLEESGLAGDHIADVDVCTLGAPEKYFSYRHASQNGREGYGRNLSGICLTGL